LVQEEVKRLAGIATIFPPATVLGGCSKPDAGYLVMWGGATKSEAGYALIPIWVAALAETLAVLDARLSDGASTREGHLMEIRA
jgi:hypothetical protein